MIVQVNRIAPGELRMTLRAVTMQGKVLKHPLFLDRIGARQESFTQALIVWKEVQVIHRADYTSKQP